MNISSVVPSIDTATETMTDFEKVDRVRRRPCATRLFWLPSGAYTRSFWIGIFHIGNFCFWVPFLKQLLLRNFAVDFVEICTVYIRKMIIKAAKGYLILIRYAIIIVIWILASLFWNTVYVKFSLATGGRFTLTPSLWATPCEYRQKWYTAEN